MERIVFLDRDAIPTHIRRPQFEHSWQEYPSTLPDQVVERLRDATIAITNRVSLRETELLRVPSVRLIAIVGTGVDCVDLATCRRRGIAVTNVRNWCHTSVTEHVFALMLALRRNLFAYHADIQNGAWQRYGAYCLLEYPIPHNLGGSTLGIIGYGLLGRTIERLAHAFGMSVLISERKGADTPRPGRASFYDVLHSSDIITLHCPLTDETRGLIGAKELKKMRSHALLINCARGEIVDEAALAAALQAREIGGAGVDVLSHEPPREDNPLLELKLPNLIVTPHVAWASVESLSTLADQIVDNLEAFVLGTPQNLVI